MTIQWLLLKKMKRKRSAKTFSSLALAVLVFLSANAQWVEKNNGLDGGAVACFATKENLIFAGTYLGGIYVSRTAGDSWERFALSNRGIYCIAINKTKMFAGSFGLYTSADGGKTWVVAKGVSDSNAIACMALNDDKIFAASGTKVFYSNDNGENWNIFSFNFQSVVRAIALIGSSIFVGCDSGLFRSDDNGANWKAIDSSIGVTSVTSHSGTIYVGSITGLMISSDNGNTWTFASCGRGAKSTFFIGNTFFSAGSSIYKSSNNGLNCVLVDRDLPSTEIRAAIAIDTVILISVKTYGVYKSNDQGDSWRLTNKGIANMTVKAIASNKTTVFAGTEDYGIFRSFDNGETWASTNTGLQEEDVYPLAVDGAAIFAVNGTSGLFKSLNNGDSWSSAQFGRNFISTLALNTSFVLAGTRIDGIFRAPITVGNVNEWTTSLSIEGITTLAVNTRFAFAGTEKFGAFISEDTGLNWKAIEAITNKNIRSIDTQANRVVVSGSNSASLYLSKDYGESWSSIGQGLPSGNVSQVKLMGNLIFVNVNDLVLFSNDDGMSWSFTSHFPGGLASLTVKEDTLFVGTYGNGVWAYSLKEGYNLITEDRQRNVTKIEIFPNPTATWLTISFPSPLKNEEKEIEIKNITGKIIESIRCHGSEKTIDVENYQPGVYIIQVGFPESTYRLKFIKIR